MEEISHVHRLQTVLLTLQKFQPVAQEMGIGAGGVLLHPGHASLKDGAVEGLCGGLSNAFFLIGVKCALHQPFQAFPLFTVVQKEPAQLQKIRLPFPFFLLLPAVPVTPQPLNQHMFAVLEGIDGPILLLAGQKLQIRKKLPHLPDEDGGPHGLSIGPSGAIGEIEAAGGLGQHQVQVKFLHTALLPGRGRQLHAVEAEKLPVPVC